MATKKKLLQAAAGQAGGGGLNVEEVFSTYLYTGDGTTSKQITNNIDLSTEGGLVWIKRRSDSSDHRLMDTERGASSYLASNTTDAASTGALSSFNTDGFTIGNASAPINAGSGSTYASWTFRKAPKFFDVVTYTGNGTAGRTISHDLGGEVGCMIIKKTSSSTDANWAVYHRETVTPDPAEFSTLLNSTAAAFRQAQHFNDTEPTSTEFTLGSSTTTNGSGETYVAYLFAHNNGDGEFGPDGDADIIKCGSYTHSGSAWTEDLGFEPQFVISKNITSTGAWQIVDNMRGLLADNGSGTAYARLLKAEVSNAENNGSGINITSTGLEGDGTGGGGSGTYIYIAIRRGPMAVPESATDVFDISHATDANDASFPVDFMLTKIMAGGNGYARDRLRGGTKYLLTDTTNADLSGTDIEFDDMTGTGLTGWGTGYIHYNWRRAPSFFDVVAYSGNSTAGRTVSHNLGVAPEMMWVRPRSFADHWNVYHTANGNTKYMRLNSDATPFTNTNVWNSTTPDASSFTLGSDFGVNGSGYPYIAYLFASLDGISKVGSYTGTGTSQTIDCGFSAGARFVLIKNATTTSTQWLLYDSVRGITSGNDPYLLLNDSAAENTASVIDIEPQNAGFEVNGTYDWLNKSGDTYIFYAIA